MKVLLTGASGFLGKTLQAHLKEHSEVVTIGRSPDSVIKCDLSFNIPKLPPVDTVVHAAGKAHVVPKSDAEKQVFYDVNVKGTQNLLDALGGNSSLQKFVFISSVSVYGLSTGTAIAEDAPLLAADAYGQSKIAAEAIVKSWCKARNLPYYILRLPLIAGKQPPGNLGDMVNGIRSGKYLSIGNASAKKSVVLADDIARLITNINGAPGVYNLTDGYHPSFGELEKFIADYFGKAKPFAIPGFAAKLLGFAGDVIGSSFPVNSGRLKKILDTLTFDDEKARYELNWHPAAVLEAWQLD